MALFEIVSLGSFAKLLLAARKLAEDTDPLDRLKALADLAENGGKLRAALGERNLGPLAARIEADCEAAKAAFGREPQAEDAWNIFQMVAPVALSQGDRLAEDGLQRAVILDSMIEAIVASDHARVFRETDLPETFFRAVMDAALKAMLGDADFVDKLTPQLWRETLRRQGIAVEMLERLDTSVRRGFAGQDAKLDALLASLRASDEAQRLSDAGITEAAFIELARRVAEDVDDLDAAWRELKNAIEVAIRVQKEWRFGSNFGDFVDEVLRRVAGLSAQGDYDAAAAEIDAALAEEDAAKAEADAARKARKIRLLEAGLEQDRMRRNAKVAAQRVVQIAESEAETPLGLRSLRAVFLEWLERGKDMGLLFDQEVSIELAQLQKKQAHGSDELGNALNDLGVSLHELGVREAGTARLEQAIEAHHAALRERPRDRVPLDWAMLQMNLGNTLRTLGEREAGTARLEKAVEAYHSALKEWTRDRVPQDWAKAQMNLGNALQTLGEREAGTARLEQAVTAFRAALEEWTRDRVPLDWASAQMNLGNALAILGEREAGTVRLSQAVEAFQEALKEWTRDRVPLDWAKAQMNLGNALATIGVREAGTVHLVQAVAAFRAALEEWTRDRVPHNWATAQMNLGTTLRILGSRELGAARLEDAVEAYRAALDERTRERVPLDWARVKFDMGLVELALFDKTGKVARLHAAEAHVRAAREVFEEAGAGQYLGMADGLLADIASRRG